MARDAVLAVAEPVGTERIQTPDALGRVTAETVTARVSLPPWANSAMDGYAIRAVDTLAATEDAPIQLEVVGDIAAGAAPDVTVTPGSAARIATGAKLPPGADAVVPVEATTPLDASGRLGSRGRDATGPLPADCLVHERVEPGGSVRAAGERPDRRRKAARARHGHHGGRRRARRRRGRSRHRGPPSSRIAVLATGDEVRAPGTELGPAGIPDANGPGLRALVTASGGEPIDLGIATDDLDDVLARLRRGLDGGADALIVSGGVSVGPYDVVKTAIERIGRIDLWRVAVQPGKPFAFGVADRPGGGAPVLLFGLPGNPVSSAVTFELFVRPAIRASPAATTCSGRSIAPSSASPCARATVGAHSCAWRRSATRPARRSVTDRAGSWSTSRAGRTATSSRPWRPPMPWPSCPRRTMSCPPAQRWTCGGSTAPSGRDAARRRTLVLHPA